MRKDFFKNKRITVFGLGLHGGGVGVVKFLAANGAKVIVTDMNDKEKLAPSLEKLKGVKNVQYVLAHHRREDFTSVDMVIKNPAIQWTDKHIKLALDHKVPVEMDSSLFFKLCKNPIIGVTGSKGKTTTATLIAQILKSAGKNVVTVGIGQTSVLDKLETLKKDSVVVFELSSWRLSALGRAKLSPQIAVFKNILRDHLNYYGTMEKYIEDKKYIFQFQKPKDWLIINHDDERLKELEVGVKSKLIRFSYSPIQLEERGVYIKDEAIFINDSEAEKKVIDIKDVTIPGRHNLSNVMAAIGAAYAFGITALQIKKGIASLKGIPHRLEFVRDFKGVRYYNDTAATIPDAGISALKAFDQTIHLIAGGNDKELDFEDFGQEIAKRAKSIILFKGSATDKLLLEVKKYLPSDHTKHLLVVDSMEKAVSAATAFAEKGEVVLLSPGAASFGLFLNEFDRGEKFRDAVKKLK